MKYLKLLGVVCSVLCGACVVEQPQGHDGARALALESGEPSILEAAQRSSSPLARRVFPFWWAAYPVEDRDGLMAEARDSAFEMAVGLVEGNRLDQGLWCEESQRLLVRAHAHGHRITVTHDRYDDILSFAWAKPSLSGNGTDGVTVRTAALPLFPELPRIWFPFWPVSADSIACKMKSEEAVLEALGAEAPAEFLSCAALNEAAWDWAWAQVPDDVRQRLEARGVRAEFLPDRDFSSGVGWLGATLEVRPPTDGTRTYQVRSPRLHTSLGALLGLGGNHYCMLLSPARAVDLLLAEGIDQLRPI